VTVARTEDLDDPTRQAVMELCVVAFEKDEFRRMFDHYIPSGGRHFLGWRGSELVSHAVVTTRWVQPDGLPILRTAFVDAVSTLPECQGLGYSSAVMTRLAGEIDDFEIGCLTAARLNFYGRLGWELWRGPLAGREDDGSITPTPEQEGVMVYRLPHTPPLDLDALITIERQPDRIWD
jgi:aminoglycoside 2'-N-acetyltransferase I